MIQPLNKQELRNKNSDEFIFFFFISLTWFTSRKSADIMNKKAYTKWYNNKKNYTSLFWYQ